MTGAGSNGEPAYAGDNRRGGSDRRDEHCRRASHDRRLERRGVDERRAGAEQRFDFLTFGTDPLTACRLVGNEDQVAQTEAQRFRGTSGKLNWMFKDRVRWKHSSEAAESIRYRVEL